MMTANNKFGKFTAAILDASCIMLVLMIINEVAGNQDCSTSSCPPNEVWTRCTGPSQNGEGGGGGCQPTCDFPFPDCCPKTCYRRGICVCGPNLVRNDTGYCVQLEDCLILPPPPSTGPTIIWEPTTMVQPLITTGADDGGGAPLASTPSIYPADGSGENGVSTAAAAAAQSVVTTAAPLVCKYNETCAIGCESTCTKRCAETDQMTLVLPDEPGAKCLCTPGWYRNAENGRCVVKGDCPEG